LGDPSSLAYACHCRLRLKFCFAHGLSAHFVVVSPSTFVATKSRIAALLFSTSSPTKKGSVAVLAAVEGCSGRDHACRIKPQRVRQIFWPQCKFGLSFGARN